MLNQIILILGGLAILSGSLLSPLSLFQDVRPQAKSNSCQSYASVLALAVQQDPRFPIDTFAKLRDTELAFRRILERMEGSPYSHVNWPKAMEILTVGKYTFDLSYENDIVVWMQRVKHYTNQSATMDSAMTALSGGRFDTVLTSVTTLNGSHYGGHIVTVLGLTGSGLDSNTQLIVFNSAIKGLGGSINYCSADNQPGDERYRAGVVQTREFSLKGFDGQGYVILRLKRIDS